MKLSLVGFWGSLAAGVALTALGLAVLVGALFRETPLFWLNVGGYPVELRDLVLANFYPSFAVYFFGLMFGSVVGWQLLRARRRSGGILLLACMLNWLLFAAITTMVLWNNVENVMEGRPLHYHVP